MRASFLLRACESVLLAYLLTFGYEVLAACSDGCENYDFEQAYAGGVWKCSGWEKDNAFAGGGSHRSSAVNNLTVEQVCEDCNRFKPCSGDCPRSVCEDPPSQSHTYKIGTCTLTGAWSGTTNHDSFKCHQEE